MADTRNDYSVYDDYERSVADCTKELKRKKDANASVMKEVNRELNIAKTTKYKDFTIIMEDYNNGKKAVEDAVEAAFTLLKKDFITYVSEKYLDYIPVHNYNFIKAAKTGIMDAFRTYDDKKHNIITHFTNLVNNRIDEYVASFEEKDRNKKNKTSNTETSDLDTDFWVYPEEDVSEASLTDVYNKFRTAEKLFKSAKEDACLNLQGFIMYIIMHNFWTYCKNNFSDLLQCGYMGVMDGLDYYKPEKAKPTTFFKTYIKCAISRYITSFLNSTTVHYASTLNKINKAIRFFDANGIAYNDITIAEYTGISLVSVKEALASKDAANISNYQDEMKNATTDSGISIADHANPEKELEDKDLKRLLVQAFNLYLSEVEQQVIFLHYGFESNPMSFKDISKTLGITVNEVKMHHQHALCNLATDELSEYYHGPEDGLWSTVKTIFLPSNTTPYQESILSLEDFFLRKDIAG